MWPSRPFQLIDLLGRFLRLWALLTVLLPGHHQSPVIFDSAASCLLKHLLVNTSGDFEVYNSASQSVVPGPELLASPLDVYIFRLHPTSTESKTLGGWPRDLHCNMPSRGFMGFPSGSLVKNRPTMQETWVRSLGQEYPLEEEMVTHSSILAWIIPWTEEPGGLQFMGLQEYIHSHINTHA